MFPVAWGTPQGDQFSEARAAWVLAKVRRHQLEAPLRRLAVRDRRLLWELRLVELERKRQP